MWNLARVNPAPTSALRPWDDHHVSVVDESQPGLISGSNLVTDSVRSRSYITVDRWVGK
jgi:hypothetical protein